MSRSWLSPVMPWKSPVERYQALLAAARCFGRSMDLRSLIDEILRRAQEVMQAEACSVLLPDPHTGELILYSTDPQIANLPEPLRVPPGAGIAGAAFQSKKIVNVSNAADDPRHYSAVARQLGMRTRAILTVPLLDGDSCLGVMQALNPRERDCFDAQDEEIFEGFGGLIVNALVRLEAQRSEIKQAQARQQLLLAQEIQESFLPRTVAQYPFCQVHHHHLPAQMVSGDFGFVHPIPDRRLLLGLGDVCGKGIPAALTMARATAIIEVMTDHLQADLGDWVTNLNRLLARELKAGRFISLTLLLADADRRSLQICTAGQYPPLRFHGQQWKPGAFTNHLPLGISPAITYVAEKADLLPGDFWLLLTDGFPEARNRGGEDYTIERFLSSLPAGQTAAQSLNAALQSWNSYRDLSVQHDDASLLLLDWRGETPASDLSTACCPENLAAIRQFVEQWAIYAGFGDTEVGQIVLACDEACANVFCHGYQRRSGPIRLFVEIARQALVIQITDEAPPVDVNGIQGRRLADLRPGGLGTFVISRVFDEVNYAPLKTGNSLALRKSLPPASLA